MVGMASMAGSKTPRLRPTSMLASRSSWVTAREALGLLVLAAQRLDDEGRLEALVRDLGDVGAQLLDPGDLRRHGALEGRRWPRGACGKTVSPTAARNGSTRIIWTTPKTSMTTTPKAIGSGCEDVPRRLDVGVGVGEQLPGRVPVVPGQREAEVLPGDPAPVGRAEVVDGDTGGDPAHDDADDVDEHDGDEDQRRPNQVGGRDRLRRDGRGDGVVDDPPDHPGRAAGHDPVDGRADDGQADPALLLADPTTDDPPPRTQRRGGRDRTEGRQRRAPCRAEGWTDGRPRSRH